MIESAALSLPLEASREELIAHYRMCLATPRTNPDAAILRRLGRDGLTLLCACPAVSSHPRRRNWLVSTHFRAKRPKGRINRA
ncbi:MAG: hypothetical protein K2Y29_07325 [Beijerinckiaceae bacterium]|nr:hypothetical protein [Beijerinckiaceae bacterium]